jgi:spore coat protein U-like protein
MAVSTLVSNSCIITAGELQFATYDTTSGTPLAGTVTIQSTCTLGGAMVMTMGPGANPHATSTDTAPVRQMIGAGGNLAHDLYIDLAHTIVWGNTSGTGKAFIATGGTDNILVYGLVPDQQAVGGGSFADSVAVTLTC